MARVRRWGPVDEVCEREGMAVSACQVDLRTPEDAQALAGVVEAVVQHMRGDGGVPVPGDRNLPVPCGECGGQGHTMRPTPGLAEHVDPDDFDYEPCPYCGGHGEFFSPLLRAGLAAVLARGCGGTSFAYGKIRTGESRLVSADVDAEFRRAMTAVADHTDGVNWLPGVRCYSLPSRAADFVEALLVAGRPCAPRQLRDVRLPPALVAWLASLGGADADRVLTVQEALDAMPRRCALKGAIVLPASVVVRQDEEASALRGYVLAAGGLLAAPPPEVAASYPLGVVAAVFPGGAR